MQRQHFEENCCTPGTDEGWVEVKRKGRTSASPAEESPTPPQNFKNLKFVDEIEMKKVATDLDKGAGGSTSNSRSSRKKQKRKRNSLGKNSPSLSK